MGKAVVVIVYLNNKQITQINSMLYRCLPASSRLEKGKKGKGGK